MGILRRGTVAIATAAIALLTAANTASAQLITFYTQGYFNGGSCGMASSSCTFGGYTISFTGNNGPGFDLNQPYTGGTVPLGQFTVAGSAGTIASLNTSFTLEIFQTSPGVPNSGTFAGNITGTFQKPPTASHLVWTPISEYLVINTLPDFSTTWKLRDIEADGTFAIAAGNTTIQADVAVAPEPGTLLLLAPGIAGLAARIRRRNKKSEV
jgi:hypothetical protein